MGMYPEPLNSLRLPVGWKIEGVESDGFETPKGTPSILLTSPGGKTWGFNSPNPTEAIYGAMGRHMFIDDEDPPQCKCPCGPCERTPCVFKETTDG